MKDLKGKTAFITGGASGIGFGIARSAAKEGANVFIADLRQNAIDEALVWFKDNNYPATGYKLDTSDRAGYKAAVDAAEAKYGNIHILVNNAGIGCKAGPLWEVTGEDTDFALRINLVGVLNGIQEIVPRMLKHGEDSFVISTASKAGLIPVPGCGLYNLTKQAVVGIMETLASDLKGTKVGSAVLCPGPFTSNLGMSGREVETELLGREPAPMGPPPSSDGNNEPPRRPPPPEGIDMSRILRDCDEAGDRVVRGIKRGDLYILTHAEFKPGWIERASAIERAFPADDPYDGFAKVFGLLVHNEIFDKQTQVPALK